MSDPGQLVARGREGHTMHPATRAVGELRHDGTKRHFLSPASRLRLVLDLLHIGREYPKVGGGKGRERECVLETSDRKLVIHFSYSMLDKEIVKSTDRVICFLSYLALKSLLPAARR
jgi:hypothetical protein